MTVPERVREFLLQNRGSEYCDDCIADQLGLRRRQQAQQATSPLTGTGPFDRQDGTCCVCGRNKKVSHAHNILPAQP